MTSALAHRPVQSPPPDGVPLFALLTPGATVVGHGIGEGVPPGPADTLGERMRRFFATHGDAQIVAGALPFDRHGQDHLLSARRLATELVLPTRRRNETRLRWTASAEPAAQDYALAVDRTLDLIRGDHGDRPLRKLVLARTVLAEADGPIDILGILGALRRDPSVTTFLVPLPRTAEGVARSLVGATPELLVARTGAAVVSHPLAGSARRSADPAADEASRRSLQASDKDTREHMLVVDFILDTLAPHCRTLAAPDRAALRATETMWHLGTKIEGVLRDPDQSAGDLVGLLHPTPAVCGVPRERAAALIPTLEPVPRGFYAGAVGWCDRGGNGVWHVSIRCAEIAGRQARLHAGAGIVLGSDPAAEVAETAAKFRAILAALGLDVEEYAA